MPVRPLTWYDCAGASTRTLEPCRHIQDVDVVHGNDGVARLRIRKTQCCGRCDVDEYSMTSSDLRSSVRWTAMRRESGDHCSAGRLRLGPALGVRASAP
jgi:hypothetical protein